MKATFTLLTFLFSFISFFAFSQAYVVTPEGLVDATNPDNSYVVIQAEGKTASELYANAIKYINKSYKSPENVIKGKVEGEHLSYITHVSEFLLYNNTGAKILIAADFTTTLNFKDGKVKFEISELLMANSQGFQLKFMGNIFKTYVVYNPKGQLRKPETKADIENYFNGTIKTLTSHLLGEIGGDDNW